MNGEQPPLDVDAPTHPYALTLPTITAIVPLHCYCRRRSGSCICGDLANSTTISRTIFHNVPVIGLRTAVLRAVIRDQLSKQILLDCVYDYVLTSYDFDNWEDILKRWDITERPQTAADV
jgi:hypothetical protein